MSSIFRVFGWLAVLTIIPAACLWTAQHRQLPVSAVEAAEAVGSWVGLMLISWVAAGLALVSPRIRRSTEPAVMIGFGVAISVGLLSYMGSQVDAAGGAIDVTKYSMNVCGLEMTFPSRPSSQTMTSNGLTYDQLTWRGGVSMVRVECLLLPLSFSRAQVVEALERQAASDGLHNVSTTQEERFVELRGYKEISEMMITYVLHWYRGSNGYVTLVFASPSANYPTKEITAFQSSMRGALAIDQ